MKIAIRVWIIISIILLAYLVLKLVDANVSLKYEVYEPRTMLGGNESIDEREKSIRSGITMLSIAIGYVILVIIGCVKFLRIIKKK